MYTLVMMTALTSGSDVPQFNGYFRDLFSFRGDCSGSGSCHGRTAGGYSTTCTGCSGGGCCGGSGGCCGGSGGCCGGSGCEGFGTRLRSFFSFGGSGCCGGSTSHSSSCHGCSGGSCYGSMAQYSTGCTGCMGSVIYDPISTPGMGYPIYPGTTYPGTTFPGTTYPTYPDNSIIPNSVDPPARQRPVQPEIDESRYGGKVLPAPGNLNSDPNRATVTVRAPANAKVFAEGTPLRMTDGERTFVTPTLPTGSKFDYTFRMDYTLDGEKRSWEKKVSVRAGGHSICDFTDQVTNKLPAPPSPIPLPSVTESKEKNLAGKMIPSAEPMSVKTPGLFPISTASTKEVIPSNKPTMLPAQKPTGPERAKFSIKLPENAVLYIDGRKNEKTGTVREFVTPPLPQGQEYKYELKVEVPGPNGYPQSATTSVSFRAGDTVPTLDFAELLK
ncbi:MAG: TIGR03000 domain-containing protein [Gemmataceae bacterium]